MALFSPVGASDASPIFQAWHEFDSSVEQWSKVNDAMHTPRSPSNTEERAEQNSSLALLTWNVDGCSALPERRISAILSRILSLAPAVDIIFLQEVSRAALAFLLGDSRIRESWFSSEADATNLEGLPFASMILLSKSRFASAGDSSAQAALGPVWRVKYPSRFGRDALCCDVLIPSSTPTSDDIRVRLINVHLDSLPIKPSYRPRQISIIASILRCAGHGLVAGDFNTVLPEDETLIQNNQLVDAWLELHPDEPGFTWGVDGEQPFPPNRLDRVAMLGLKVQDIEVMHPEAIIAPTFQIPEDLQSQQQDHSDDSDYDSDDELLPWSDHSALRCVFGLVED